VNSRQAGNLKRDKRKNCCLLITVLLILIGLFMVAVFHTNIFLTREPVQTYKSPSGEYTLEVYARYISHYWGGYRSSPGVVLLKDSDGKVVHRTTVERAGILHGPEWKKDHVEEGFRLNIPYPLKK